MVYLIHASIWCISDINSRRDTVCHDSSHKSHCPLRSIEAHHRYSCTFRNSQSMNCFSKCKRSIIVFLKSPFFYLSLSLDEHSIPIFIFLDCLLELFYEGSWFFGSKTMLPHFDWQFCVDIGCPIKIFASRICIQQCL